MMAKAKKQKTNKSAAVQPELPSSGLPVLPLKAWGSKEVPANATIAFCKIPDELISEILSHFDAIGPLTSTSRDDSETSRPFTEPEPILPSRYLCRPVTLRALSQTCVAWRGIFLPILWERLEVCVESRFGEQFFRHAGETLTRKCTGLMENPDLLAMVRCVNVILTRYKTDMVLPKFTACLKVMPNLLTIHVLHAHTQMTSHIKAAFEGVSLPQIHNLIIPGYCHELLKCCPEARSIRCIRDDGSKLVTVIKRDCKKVEEVRGFLWNDKLMKRLVAAAPNIRTLEIWPNPDDAILAHLQGLKHLSTIVILTTRELSDQAVQLTIKKVRPILKASPSTERKYLRLCHEKKTRLVGLATYTDVELD